MYYFSINAEFMNTSDINDLLSYIKDTVDEMEDRGPAASSLKFLDNSKAAIKVKAETDSRFAQILV